MQLATPFIVPSAPDFSARKPVKKSNRQDKHVSTAKSDPQHAKSEEAEQNKNAGSNNLAQLLASCCDCV